MECVSALEIVTSGQKKSLEVWTLESSKSMLTEVTENFAKLQEKRRFKTRPNISSAAARGYFVWLGSGSQQGEQFRRAPWTNLTILENNSSHVLLLIKGQAKNLSPNYLTFTMNIGSLFRSLSTIQYIWQQAVGIGQIPLKAT